jgi:hypothetical protein
MAVRKAETFPPVTMAHIRGHGCRDLLVYCNSGRCHHSATLSGDRIHDDMPVRSLCGRMVSHPWLGARGFHCGRRQPHVVVIVRGLSRGREPSASSTAAVGFPLV